MKHRAGKWVLVSVLLVACVGCPEHVNSWAWNTKGNVLEIAHGNAADGWPQMAALHLNTSALRIIYGPDSGWGPTVYLAPSLWTADAAKSEQYFLGAPISVSVSEQGENLVLEVTGTIGGLGFATTVAFSPPSGDVFEASVSTATSGAVTLADRPGEAFQPVHAATMRISETQWDTSAIRLADGDHALPAEGWVLSPPGATGDAFTLVGGSSIWKPGAPNIAIQLDRAMTLQGWVAASSDPNDDNVGFWCAADTVLPNWTCTITASRPSE